MIHANGKRGLGSEVVVPFLRRFVLSVNERATSRFSSVFCSYASDDEYVCRVESGRQVLFFFEKVKRTDARWSTGISSKNMYVYSKNICAEEENRVFSKL